MYGNFDYLGSKAIKLTFQQSSLGLRLFFLVALSITLMTLDHRFHHVDQLRASLSIIIYPIRYIVNMPADMGDWASQAFMSRKSLQAENIDLKTKNRLLKAELQKFNYVKTENLHLRALLKSSKKFDSRVLIAELLSVDLDPYKRQVVINKGSNNDVYPGQPIVDAQGVMGLVTHVSLFTSSALLITDPNPSLPLQLLRNGMRAIASGTGAANRIELENIPNNSDIKVGDKFVSSGLGCVFPTGYPAGHIIEINTDPSLPFAHVIAEPAAALDRSREVLLVWPSDERQTNTSNPCQQIKEVKP